MSFLRPSILRRTIVFFFLLIFSTQLLLPTATYALTSGPHQPEYMSFEEASSTDMVNLATGDFTYNLPVLDVPGPEGGYSLPLSYHAGIGLEQQASWVGLGWNMNVGSVTRSINQYPDDALDELHSVTVKDLTGVVGFQANGIFGPIGYNSATGSYGSISILGLINTEWGNGNSSFGSGGINVGSKGVEFNSVQFAMAAITVASWGAGGAFASGAAFAKAVAVDVAMQAVMNTVTPVATPTAPTAGHWAYSKKTKKYLLGTAKSYRIWLDQTRYEKMYGILNLGKVPYTDYTNADNFADLSLNVNGTAQSSIKQFKKLDAATGAATDMNYEVDGAYKDINNPAFLAMDDYTVSAPGISGSITPYRLDIGSVSMPREMSSKHNRLAPVPFTDYKVPFIYQGTLSNNYYNHVGGATGVSSPAFYFGISTALGNSTPSSNTSLTYNLNDVIFSSQRVRPDVSGIAAANRNILPQSNHVEWLSNSEIKNAITYPTSKFLDFLKASGGTASDRYKFRDSYAFGSLDYATTAPYFNNSFVLDATTAAYVNANDFIDLDIVFFESEQDAIDGIISSYPHFDNVQVATVNSTTNEVTVNDSRLTPYYGKYAVIRVIIKKTPKQPHAIGGFCVTASSGITYHFALPTYDYDLLTEIVDVNDDQKKSAIKRNAAFANTWLLTTITGPDYIDRNADGLAGPEDWGYWVKFNYGKHLDGYDWRTPFNGGTPSASATTYSSGKKQLIYLNSIETRSHVALFLKSNRDDGKSKTGQQPLKLDEIVLLKRAHYNNLVTTYGVTDFSNQLSAMCLSATFTSSLRTAVNSTALKRIVFTQDYQLCQQTPNSTGDGVGGKLRLAKVSIFGKNNKKTVPDYKFEYANNPNYSQDYWDGWGMYNSTGSHKASEIDADGSAWSLTKITSPLGATITINYERDSYYSISGYTMPGPAYPFTYTKWATGNEPIYCFDVLSTAGFQVGDYVSLSGTKTYTCPGTTQQVTVPVGPQSLPIDAINGNQICLGLPYTSTGCPTGSYWVSLAGEVYNTGVQKKGGNIRVKSILLSDPQGVQSSTQYEYTLENGKSSGAIAKEPEFIKTAHYNFYDIPYYPFTPVIYSRVSVLTGTIPLPPPLSSSYATKMVYEFETPTSTVVSHSKTNVTSGNQLIASNFFGLVQYKDFLNVSEHKISDNSSRIGALRSVKVYAAFNVLSSSTELQYTDGSNNGISNDQGIAHQGVYTQGTIMMDRVDPSTNERYHKINRTTVIDYPYTLKKIIQSKDGNTVETENLKLDFISGNVTQKLSKSALGIYTKTVSKPAFRVYPALATKAADPNNKNMVNQEVANYIFKSNSNGTSLGIIAATAKTWKTDGNNYREYDATTSSYYDGQDPVSVSNPVWRVSSFYTFKGDITKLQSDGSFSYAAADEFNFAGANPGWQYLGEATKFDHYSMPVESKDLNNIFSSTIMGYDQQDVLAQASNAGYKEIAYSGAEDKISNRPYFGGEVAVGAGTLVNTPVHSGSSSLSLSSGYGFTFKSNGILANKAYRASVWANSTNGRIYYKINNGTEESPAPVISHAVSVNGVNWYRIDLPIEVGNISNPSIEVGVKSTSGIVVFDDFRFQPADAAMTGYVYDANTGQPAFVLDNDNLFTAYEYDDSGLLIRTKRESITYGVKLVSETQHDFKRFHKDQ
jgi:hypothetical protein